jgi:hypothetical protein
VRKEYDLHHLKPYLATSDVTTTTINTCFFLKYFYMRNLPVPARERVNMAIMALSPSSTKSWQNMTSTRDTLAKKYQQIAGVNAHCFNATAEKNSK